MSGWNSEKNQIEYLFLDMEWNQAADTTGLEGRDAIQIGALAADITMQKVRTFSKAIRLKNPERLTEETCRVTHTSADNLMLANPEGTVLKNFMKTFPTYRYIVVWSRETYDLWKRDMKRYAFSLKRHQVIVLQEVLNLIAGDEKQTIGFERALRCAEIKYVSGYLHYCKHDVEYLYQLFIKCQKQYSEMTMQEPCVANRHTKRLHDPGCRYVSRMSSETELIKQKSDIFTGYTVCKCCEKEWKRWGWNDKKWLQRRRRESLKQLPLTEKNIEKICSYFQMTYVVCNGTIFIRTPFSRWIIYLKNDKVVNLFHGNDRISKSQYCKKQKKKCLEGYHKQKMPSDNLYEIIQYIKAHDSSKMKRMPKKTRLEKLFDMIAVQS